MSERPQAKLNGEVNYPRLGLETATKSSAEFHLLSQSLKLLQLNQHISIF
jgi:hypothetical protein